MSKTGEQTPIESRRTAILEAAQTCFFQYGLDQTRMEDIARLAQISRPGLYKHFENNAAISLALACAFLVSCLQETEVELQRSRPVWKRITAAFEVWSVRPLEMIVAAPHADEIIQAGSGLAANVYREETERLHGSSLGSDRMPRAKGNLTSREPV